MNAEGDDVMVSRTVLQVALLEQQLQQTRLDMAELATRLTKTDEKLQMILDTMHEVKGGRTTLAWLLSAVAGAASFITWMLTHWK